MAGRNIKLQDLRTEKHWTLRAAALHVGVTKTVLFNAEQGVMPRVDHAIQIAGQYKRSVEDLWAPLPRGELEPSSDRHDSRRKPVTKTSICPRAASKLSFAHSFAKNANEWGTLRPPWVFVQRVGVLRIAMNDICSRSG